MRINGGLYEEQDAGHYLTPGDVMCLGLARHDAKHGGRLNAGDEWPVRQTWSDSPAWRARIERARRDSRRHAEKCALNAIEGTGVVFASEDVAGIKAIIEDVYNE